MRPPFGLCLPCRYRRCRDGDTVEVSLPGSDRLWAIRLLDCWAPELGEPGGPEAKAFAEETLSECDDLAVWVPAPTDAEHLLRGLLSFDRFVGDIFVGTEDRLSEMLVHAKLATREKRR